MVESTGLTLVWEIVTAFISTLVTDVGGFLITTLTAGLFDAFVGTIFGGGIDVELAFLLVLALFMWAFAWKYIFSVVN